MVQIYFKSGKVLIPHPFSSQALEKTDPTSRLVSPQAKPNSIIGLFLRAPHPLPFSSQPSKETDLTGFRKPVRSIIQHDVLI